MPQIHVEGKPNWPPKDFVTTIAGIPVVYEASAPEDKIVIHPSLKPSMDRLFNLVGVKTQVQVEV